MPQGGAASRVDSDEIDVEIVPLTATTSRTIFQRGNSSALSSSQPDDEPQGNLMLIQNDNARTHGAKPPPSSSNIGNRLTPLQFVLRARVLRVLLPEFVACQLLLSYGTHWPLQWQQERCAAFLADRPPPFQELQGGELVLDPTLNHPSEHSQISTELLVQTAIQIPIFVVWITAICLADTRDSDTIDVFRLFQFPVARISHFLASLSAIFATIAASEMVTQTLKAVVTRRRPNFYALCGFDPATQTCTGTEFWRCEAQHSFPSGHSSLTMCAATFLSFFWASHILRSSRLSIAGKRIAVVCTITPLFGWALHVAATRLVDKYHHYDDVLAGCLLGVLVPTITFHLFFPPLWHPQVGTPWAVVHLQRKESAAA